MGAAICNKQFKNEYIGSIEGIFIDNTSDNRGGAIANGGIIDSIKGVFINNKVTNANQREGSAIWQYGVVNSIKGYFEGNRGSSAIVAYLRPIWNDSKYNIGSIEGIFIDNDGGIKNQGQSINKINATFLNNTQEALWNGWGGAVINDVSGQMEGNHRGIFNGPSGQIKNISVNFINNYADSLSESGASGGAIYNSGSIGDISGSFKNNTAKTNGGAIFNEGTIGDITADFENNVASSRGGAIYNSGSIGDISGSFKNNTAKNNGGAIYNKGTINSIKGSFINNSASDSSAINKDPGNGSTIWNLGYIDTIEGYF